MLRYGEALLDSFDVVGGPGRFRRGARLIEEDKRGDVDIAALEIGARDADVDLTIVNRDEGDLELGVGAGSADTLADYWDAGPYRFGRRTLLAWLCHAMRVADAGLQTSGWLTMQK